MHKPGLTYLPATILFGLVAIGSVVIYQTFAYGSTSRVNHAAGGQQSATYSAVQLFDQTMPVLKQGYYQLAVTDSSGVEHALGAFTINDNHQVIGTDGIEIRNAAFALPAATTQIRTIQVYLAFDTSGDTNKVLFMQAPVAQDRALLQFVGVANASQAKGSYMLGTPTDGNDTINERSGVWFGNYSQAISALSLPAPRQGWVYEGWAIVNNRPLTTGRFTDPSKADSFAGFSDSQVATPQIPGEDLLVNAPIRVFPDLAFPVDLANQQIQVSLEPDINGIDPTGQSPFGITVLNATVPGGAAPHQLYQLVNQTEALPKATAALR